MLALMGVIAIVALVQTGRFAGPVELIVHDRPFQAGAVLWGLLCVGIVYADKIGINWGKILSF